MQAMFVYIARYTNQPVSEIRAMGLRRFYNWHRATSDMIGREQE